MFTVIAIMCAGLLAGISLRSPLRKHRLDTPILCTVALLLFLMGAEVGGDKTITARLSSLGSDALLLALSCTLGSVLFSWIVYRLFFFKKENTK